MTTHFFHAQRHAMHGCGSRLIVQSCAARRSADHVRQADDVRVPCQPVKLRRVSRHDHQWALCGKVLRNRHDPVGVSPALMMSEDGDGTAVACLLAPAIFGFLHKPADVRNGSTVAPANIHQLLYDPREGDSRFEVWHGLQPRTKGE
ncbi:hypothetical protein [Novosphingopyxis iocasae]|uniref:hypothetical protein n=1 Tax=Novosphingopyxis iocasae TaxID=2762729 RepID=UPI001FE45D98|nr:hypothetical protein [Novosphingopyxis iocasae]